MKSDKIKLCKSCNKNPRHTWRTICISCINELAKKKSREQKKRKTERETNRKKLAKEKKVNSVTYLDKKIEIDWRKAVKINYCWVCAYCGKNDSEAQLHCHHLFTRSRKSTRWDIDNWILLCASHHTLSSEFSAHMTWNEFFIWLESIKWRKWIDELMKRSNKIVSYTPEFIKEKHEIIKEFLENSAK